MRRYGDILWYALLLVVLPQFASASIPGSRDLEARFRSEYPVAASRLEAAASKIICEGQMDREGLIVQNIKIYINKGNKLGIKDYKLIHSKPSEKVSVFCSTSDYFFVLDKKNSQQPFTVSVVARGPDIPEKLEHTMRYNMSRFVESAYTIGEVSITAMLAHPSFTITEISEVGHVGDQQAVAIRFRYNNPSHWIGGGRMVFTPALDWALSGYDVEIVSGRPGMERMPKGSSYKGSIHCRRWSSGFVFPEEGQFEFIIVDKGQGADRFHFTEVEAADVPESQFKLSAFGLPDTLLDPPSPRRLNYWLLAICLPLLILAVSMRSYLSRRSSPARSS